MKEFFLSLQPLLFLSLSLILTKNTHHVLPLREVHLEQVAVVAVQRPERVVAEPELGVDSQEAKGEDETGLQRERVAA